MIQYVQQVGLGNVRAVSTSAVVCQFDNLVLERLRTCKNLVHITWKKLAGIDLLVYVHGN